MVETRSRGQRRWQVAGLVLNVVGIGLMVARIWVVALVVLVAAVACYLVAVVALARR